MSTAAAPADPGPRRCDVERAGAVEDADVLAARPADRHPPEPPVLLRPHPAEVALTELAGERLRPTTWRDGAGLRTLTR
ncbi:hypothetical protein AB2L28_08030 [Kineococcus sp. TBRC 1896]|uniref:Uncharacterized protein n=1 Tax=Kineococcus mangrovi TaxID=1660183 RepID=A0ABV4I0I7_9ACTN